MPAPSKDILTPSELVLIHGRRFAAQKRPIKLTIAFLAASVLCGYMTYRIAGTIFDEWGSRSWPKVQGTIISSQVIKDGDTYRADVQFKYEVEGQLYKGDTVSFGLRGLSSGSDSGMKGIVHQYPEGAAVQVAYDPSNPATGVLEPGIQAISLAILLMVVLPTIFSVAVVIAQLPSLLRR